MFIYCMCQDDAKEGTDCFVLIAYADHEKSRTSGRGCNISPRLLFNACSFSTFSKIPFMTPVFPSRYESGLSDWVPPADYITEDPLQGPLEGPLQCPSGVQPEATTGPLPLAAPAGSPPGFPPLAEVAFQEMSSEDPIGSGPSSTSGEPAYWQELEGNRVLWCAISARLVARSKVHRHLQQDGAGSCTNPGECPLRGRKFLKTFESHVDHIACPCGVTVRRGKGTLRKAVYEHICTTSVPPCCREGQGRTSSWSPWPTLPNREHGQGDESQVWHLPS